MKYKIAVFDMDGTILNTLDDITRSINYALETCGYPKRTAQEVRGFLGCGAGVLAARSLPEGTAQEEIDRVCAVQSEYYQSNCAIDTRPYDGIIELIGRLRAAGVRTAVVSNKGDAAVKRLAEEYFTGLFDTAEGARAGMERKPAPDLVNEALRKLGAVRDSAVYIGDTEVDMLTAKNSGMDAITVGWGFRDSEFLLAAGAERICNTPDEVYALIVGE
ncbi:MAG: HAD family hydrolase [Oscillospiraceae bacterium]|nr:HAD family hydrolase [Oscillospiraceae bacterium]